MTRSMCLIETLWIVGPTSRVILNLLKLRKQIFRSIFRNPCRDGSEKIQVRINLVSSLAAAQITFLSGIESTSKQVRCINVAYIVIFHALLHCVL